MGYPMTPGAGLYDASVQPPRTLLWALIALALTDLVMFSGASNYLASPQSRILNQVLILAVGVAAAILAWRGRLDVRSPLVLPGVAVIAATALAAVTSQRPEASREALAFVLVAAPSYLVIRAVLAEPWLRARVDGLIVIGGFLFTAAYLVHALTQWVVFWSVVGPAIPPLRPGDVGLTVGTVNAVSLYLELLVPIGVALAWARWRNTRFVVVYIGLAIVAMLITGSRGAWLGGLAGAAAAVAVVVGGDGRALGRARLGRRARIIGLGAVAIGAVVLGPGLLARLGGGDAGRLELWGAAWSMFAGHPLTGVGPGAWPGLRPLTPISEDVLAVLYTAHSSVLHVLAELGIVGAAAVLWLVVTVAQLARRAIRTRPVDGLAAAAVVSLVAFAVHSLVDVQVHIPAVVLLLMLLVARLDPGGSAGRPVTSPGSGTPGRARSAAGAGRDRRALGGLAILAPVLVGAALLVPIDVAMVRAEFGNRHLDRGEAAAALADFDAAIALHDLPVYRLGQAIGRRAAGDAAGSMISLDRMAEDEPFTFVQSARAMLLGQAGQATEAEALLAEVEASATYDPTALLQVAVQRASGPDADPGAAARDLARVMVAVPSLIHSAPPPGLFEAETWAAAQLDAITRLSATDPALAAAAAIQAGRATNPINALDAAAAAALDAVSDPDERLALETLQAAVDGRSPELGPIDAMIRADPASPTKRGLAWAIGFAARSQPLIDRVARVSEVLAFAAPQAPMEIVVDGRSDADWSLRLPRYPNAASSRLGPDRPYLPDLVTIEPVYRPKP